MRKLLLSSSILWVVCFGLWAASDAQECDEWTSYFNHNSPLGNDGDEESLEIVREYSSLQLCDEPTAVDVRVDNPEETDYRDEGQVVTLDGNKGFKCRNVDQTDGRDCMNYKIRFCCPAVIGICRNPEYWSKWYGDGDVTADGDDETLETIRDAERETLIDTCPHPTAIEVRLVESNKPYIFGFNVLDVGLDRGLRCVTEDQPIGINIDLLKYLCPNDECSDELKAFLEQFAARRSDTKQCEDYKIRLCCEFTVARLLGDKLDSFLSKLNPAEEDEEEEIPSQADSFFQRGESLFSFNDGEDPETC